MTKHDEILVYIKNLQVGTKVSVRSIASDLNVSEGTAYRAIKDAEISGFVNTIPRVGTIRIEKMEKKNIETLTYGEVVNIVDGLVLGGKEGLRKTLNKFIIGAMKIDAMRKYISSGNLLIVGNREEAHRLALENECAVLITGGFGCSEDVKALADERKLPIISSSYDTFTTATLINKAISERLIKKDIVLVEDVMNPNPLYLYSNYTVKRWKEVMKESGYNKFPVLDERDKLVGVVTSKDLGANVKDEDTVAKVMTRHPVTVSQITSVAFAAHTMVWDSLEIIPVVENKKLVGVIGRSDVLRALQNTSKQPHVSETFEDGITKNFSCKYTDDGIIMNGKITSQMYGPAGSTSTSILTMLMSVACSTALRHKYHSVFADSLSVFFIKPIQIDSNVTIRARVMESGRSFAKVDVEMYDASKQPCIKGLMSAKVMKK